MYRLCVCNAADKLAPEQIEALLSAETLKPSERLAMWPLNPEDGEAQRLAQVEKVLRGDLTPPPPKAERLSAEAEARRIRAARYCKEMYESGQQRQEAALAAAEAAGAGAV